MRKLPKYSSIDEEAASWARSRSGLLVGTPLGYPASKGCIEDTARARADALGTVAIRFRPARCLSDSCPTKKNSRSFLIGPPIDPPYWFSRRGVLPDPSKKLRASTLLLRKYSKMPPCSSLPPDL